MDGELLVEILEEAGLSPYQAEVYVCLLELGTGSATEIADASGVPDARIYDVLRDLDKRGYVELYEQDTFRARVVDLDTVIEDLTTRAERIDQAVDEIENRWQQPSLDEYSVSIVQRFETVLEAATEYIEDAEIQVHATVTPDQYEALSEELRAAYERGVTVNVTVLVDEPENPIESGKFEGVCTEVRERPHPSPFIVTADLKRTAFSPNPAAIEEYGIALESRSFTYVFFWYFLCFMWLPWPVVHTQQDVEVPVRYADVRRFLLECEPLLQEGASITVDVSGRDVQGGDARSISGQVIDIEHADEMPTALESDLLRLTGQASFSVDTGDDVVSVGGWGAQFEDIEARRITVTAFES